TVWARASGQVVECYSVRGPRRSEREWYAKQVEARFQELQAGKTTVEFLLQAQSQFATALSQEYQAITEYNIALVGLEFAKGTILQHDNVVITEGPLPHCAQVRAVEHERERTLACVLRERASPVAYRPCGTENRGPSPPLP